MTASQEGRIFINYRRVDSDGYAGRIFDRLAAHFGEEAVFMDVDTIEAGLDFVQVLEDAVQSCDVIIVLIGRQWLKVKDNRGERRLDNPEDFVRIEIVAALNRDIRVIPVLVGGVDMPRSTELPENLKLLARRNALQVNHHSFNPDVYRLIEHLEFALDAAEKSKIIKVQALKEKQAHAQRQAEIEKLTTQADTAINWQDWQLAEKKLKDILNLAPKDIQTQAKLEIVEEKLAAVEVEKERKAGNEISMCLVPEGEFTMGSNEQSDEKPPHQVVLDVFYMDQYEVTNILYKACVEAGVCAEPKSTNYYNNSAYANHPVVYVDWNQAKAYCEWRDADLPSESQWEKAARGTDERTYPWGEGIDCNIANYYDSTQNKSCVGGTTEVGSYESGKSPYGLYDMAGNVWEWVADWYDENYYANSPSLNPLGSNTGSYRVLRGGSWYNNVFNLRASDRYWSIPDNNVSNFGFRCSRSRP